MSIAFQDFTPTRERTGGVLQPPDYEPLAQLVERASAWIDAQGVTVINIETVVLPNLHSAREEGSTDAELIAQGQTTRWNQFVRVWYRRP